MKLIHIQINNALTEGNYEYTNSSHKINTYIC